VTNIDSIDLPKHIGGTIDLDFSLNQITNISFKFPDSINNPLNLNISNNKI